MRCETLFYVDGLAVGVERALDANLFAFVLLQLFLAVDIVRLTAGILQNELVARLGYRSAEGLAVAGGLRLRVRTGLAGWRLRAGLLAGRRLAGIGRAGLLARRRCSGLILSGLLRLRGRTADDGELASGCCANSGAALNARASVPSIQKDFVGLFIIILRGIWCGSCFLSKHGANNSPKICSFLRTFCSARATVCD